MKKLLILANILLLTGCVTLLDEDGRQGSFTPTPLFLRNLPQDDSKYSAGFRDGCYNFIGQNGYGMSRLYDRPVRSEREFLGNDLYMQGYRHGDRYCGVYVNKQIIL